MKTALLSVGFLFAVVFTATGQYMRHTFPEAFHNDVGMRMMYRSAHVYILFAALLNLAIGWGYHPPFPGWREKLQRFGASVLLLTPAIFTIAFFVEPAPGRLDRPVVLVGAVGCIFSIGSFTVLALFPPKDEPATDDANAS